jgi:putative transposase
VKRHTSEQIVQLLHEADRELGKGGTLEDFCRNRQVSTATYYRWKQRYGGMSVKEAKRLKALEAENTKLKRLLAEVMLANDALQESLAKKV